MEALDSVESRFCCISHVGTDSIEARNEDIPYSIKGRKDVIPGAPYSMLLGSPVILVIGAVETTRPALTDSDNDNTAQRGPLYAHVTDRIWTN
jgi:hypothetical protein